VPGQPRCKSDTVIRAAAAGGGVLGVTLVRAFVGRGRPGLDDLVAHIDHVARLVGVEHVGIGSDVDADAVDPATGRVRPAYAIRGLDPAMRAFQLADALLARGYAGRDVERVLGGNFLRALAANWPRGPERAGAERRAQRDPFCPAPNPRPPLPAAGG
jgi:membrane dipeptidase